MHGYGRSRTRKRAIGRAARRSALAHLLCSLDCHTAVGKGAVVQRDHLRLSSVPRSSRTVSHPSLMKPARCSSCHKLSRSFLILAHPIFSHLFVVTSEYIYSTCSANLKEWPHHSPWRPSPLRPSPQRLISPRRCPQAAIHLLLHPPCRPCTSQRRRMTTPRSSPSSRNPSPPRTAPSWPTVGMGRGSLHYTGLLSTIMCRSSDCCWTRAPKLTHEAASWRRLRFTGLQGESSHAILLPLELSRLGGRQSPGRKRMPNARETRARQHR